MGALNKEGAPQMSLVVVGGCTQAFMLLLLLSADAYDFAYSMCTVSIVITWALAAMYQVKLSGERHEAGQLAIGLVASVFLVVGVLFNGWSFLLLTCVGYIPGFVVYALRRAGTRRGLGGASIRWASWWSPLWARSRSCCSAWESSACNHCNQRNWAARKD